MPGGVSSEKSEKVAVLGRGVRTGRRIWDSGEEGELRRALQARRGIWTVWLPAAGATLGYSDPRVDGVFQTGTEWDEPRNWGGSSRSCCSWVRLEGREAGGGRDGVKGGAQVWEESGAPVPDGWGLCACTCVHAWFVCVRVCMFCVLLTGGCWRADLQRQGREHEGPDCGVRTERHWELLSRTGRPLWPRYAGRAQAGRRGVLGLL